MSYSSKDSHRGVLEIFAEARLCVSANPIATFDERHANYAEKNREANRNWYAKNRLDPVFRARRSAESYASHKRKRERERIALQGDSPSDSDKT